MLRQKEDIDERWKDIIGSWSCRMGRHCTMKGFGDNIEHLNCPGNLLVQLIKQMCYLNIACYAHTCPGLQNLDSCRHQDLSWVTHQIHSYFPVPICHLGWTHLIGGSISKLKSNQSLFWPWQKNDENIIHSVTAFCRQNANLMYDPWCVSGSWWFGFRFMVAIVITSSWAVLDKLNCL